MARMIPLLMPSTVCQAMGFKPHFQGNERVVEQKREDVMIQSVVLIGPFKDGASGLKNDLDQTHQVLYLPTFASVIDSLHANPYMSQAPIVLDLLVPDEDGLAVLEHLKLVSPYQEVVVLAPTSNPDWAIASMGLGAYVYLTYDVSSRVLGTYLQQIRSQANWFDQTEQLMQKKMISQMDVRLALAHELLSKRRQEGQTLGPSDFLILFGCTKNEESQRLADQLTQGLLASPPLAQVLLLEDEPMIAAPIQALLHSKGHCQVTIASCIHEAKGLLDSTTHWQLAILDIGLPDGSGLDLMTPIRDHSPHSELVILTAYHELELIQTAFKQGASDYLQKPFRAYQLLQVMGRAIQRSHYHTLLPGALTAVPSLTVTLPFRMTLLAELIAWRRQKNRAINTRELSVFIPSLLKSSMTHLDQWYDAVLFEGGLTLFLHTHFPDAIEDTQLELRYLSS